VTEMPVAWSCWLDNRPSCLVSNQRTWPSLDPATMTLAELACRTAKTSLWLVCILPATFALPMSNSNPPLCPPRPMSAGLARPHDSEYSDGDGTWKLATPPVYYSLAVKAILSTM